MLTTHCTFHINHDGNSHEVIFTAHTGKTAIFSQPTGTGSLARRIVFEMQFVCEDRKAAELIVQLYTKQKNKS